MGPKRNRHQRELDLELINRWYLAGKSLRTIAADLSAQRPYTVNHKTIWNDLEELRRRWRENTVLALDEHRAKELARLDTLEAEYWRAWEESRQPRKISRSKLSKRASGQVSESSLTDEQRTGNPAYLAGVERCIAQRIKLLGIAEEKNQVALSGQLSFTLSFPDGAIDGDE
jgi:hypothetical protein